jgi:hypothetical protein
MNPHQKHRAMKNDNQLNRTEMDVLVTGTESCSTHEDGVLVIVEQRKPAQSVTPKPSNS